MKTRIKELRAREGYTQADLAKLVGVRRETISFVENGEYNPSLLLAKRIATVFEEPIEEIFLFDVDELQVD
jgi:putative transcriptional regulator